MQEGSSNITNEVVTSGVLFSLIRVSSVWFAVFGRIQSPLSLPGME